MFVVIALSTIIKIIILIHLSEERTFLHQGLELVIEYQDESATSATEHV